MKQLINKIVSSLDNNSKSYWFNLFGFPIFAIYHHRTIGWIRIFGVGLSWKNTLVHPLSFSQRNGYRKGLKLGKWMIGYLPPDRAAKQPPQRIAEQQYNLLKLKQLQNHEAKNKNSNSNNTSNKR